ncbi:MAG: TA system VapC family ribonuclease toxin [Dermatophilaceae bacterium]
MTRALLDVNVVIALVDPDHVDHARVHEWARDGLSSGWASCAITQNGLVRILSQPAYPGTVTVTEAIALLSASIADTDHQFCACGLSLVDPDVVTPSGLLGHRQVTETYLLALAVHRGGRFVTLDRSVPLIAVPGASEEHLTVL